MTGRRAVAHIADGVVYAMIAIILILPAAASGSSVFLTISLVLVAFPGLIAYYVLTQRRNGQSPGKRLARIKVVDAQGETPPVGALVRRSIPLLVEYFYVIALTAMLSSPYRQRLGDRWGHTYVVAA